MNRDKETKATLEQALETIPVPESLFHFAAQVPARCARDELEAEPKPNRGSAASSGRKRLPAVMKGAAAAAVLIAAISAGVTMSPALASMVKGVPGIGVAVDWLTQLREQDGVQGAINHGYVPIEPATLQAEGMTITISDIYLTDEELLFKSFIRFDEAAAAARREEEIMIVPLNNLLGGGSTTHSDVAESEDGSGEVRQDTYKYHLAEGTVQQFLNSGEDIEFVVSRHTFRDELQTVEYREIGTIKVPVTPDKLLHNRVLEPQLAMPTADPELTELSWEKLTIQPTTMNVVLKAPEGWEYDFPRDEETAPYLKDDQGNVYMYDPSGPALLFDEAGKQQLPFSSSVYFNPDVRSLTLHIGEMTISEAKPSLETKLDLSGGFPQAIRFKGEDIVVEGAEYLPEGYLHLKIGKLEPEQTKLSGVSFKIAEREKFAGTEPEAYNASIRKQSEDRKALGISAFGIAEGSREQPQLDVYLPAPKRDSYTLLLSRTNDRIAVNKDYTIPLHPKP
ncbi:DUF4179 domain-containing protein [Paenibacillus ginsengihumi]|uniref:DUF4179 domain-containing protein n=1 Tax=Paenibacillus ginsengihumi TaxID=431596 RepID=UPI000365E731|nr:DUF4179 domain-containing protein [Paenibacillus ginsengihumi]